MVQSPLQPGLRCRRASQPTAAAILREKMEQGIISRRNRASKVRLRGVYALVIGKMTGLL